jgi:hypothetical protein
LTIIDINRNEHKEINENNLDEYNRPFSLRDKDLSYNIYFFRIDWNDKYFDRWERRPDYYNRQ